MVDQLSPTTEASAISGPILDAIDDPNLVEISYNSDGRVFCHHFMGGPRDGGQWAPEAAERLIRWCASANGTVITRTRPILSARIPGYPHRIEALLPPVVAAPTFSIRRHMSAAGTPLPQLEHFDWSDTNHGPDDIVHALKRRRNIVVAGATGSGKTTFANACLAELARLHPTLRVVLIEDTPELQASAVLANVVALRTSDTVSQQQLLVSALRLAPGRIIVGECRDGAAALTLMKAWSTGHPGGITTLHANGAREVVPRLDQLCSEVAVTSQERMIRSTVGVAVFLDRGIGKPVVREILEMD